MSGTHTSTGAPVGLSPQIRLWLAGPEVQDAYRHDRLDEHDRVRCERTPALCKRPDWRVSRVLKQHHRQVEPDRLANARDGSEVLAPVSQRYSLSHCRGHAVLASANFPTCLGVDLEALRIRDYTRMLDFFVSPDEHQWWRQQPDRGIAFYRLWTVKEALIKALGLSFPADLPRVGFRPDESCPSGFRLEAPGPCRWQGISVVLDGRWLLSCVWSAGAGMPDPSTDWRFFDSQPWQMTDEYCFGLRHPMLSSSGGTPGMC